MRRKALRNELEYILRPNEFAFQGLFPSQHLLMPFCSLEEIEEFRKRQRTCSLLDSSILILSATGIQGRRIRFRLVQAMRGSFSRTPEHFQVQVVAGSQGV